MNAAASRILTPYLALAMEDVRKQRTGRCMCGDCTLVAVVVTAWRMHWEAVERTGQKITVFQ